MSLASGLEYKYTIRERPNYFVTEGRLLNAVYFRQGLTCILELNISFFLRLRLCLCRPSSHVRFLSLALMLASLRRTCEPALREQDIGPRGF